MQAFLAAVEEFDWVIIDSPPISMFADALSLAAQVDGVMLVARAGLTRRPDFERSLEALKKNRMVGVVFNGYDSPQKDYYTAYYGSSAR
jgi:Mrp family chromosome partitioning ATPase